MTFEDELLKLVRKPVFLVKMTLDYCSLFYSIAPCLAPAPPPYCYYTYSTCRYLQAYTRAEKEYRFSLKNGWHVPDALPLIVSLSVDNQEIDVENNITVQGKIKVGLQDMRPEYWANPDKSIGSPNPPRSNVESDGRFLLNMLARNPNFQNRPLQVLKGFEGLPESEYKNIWRGVIDDIEPSDSGFVISGSDSTRLIIDKFPTTSGSGTLLYDPIDIDTTDDVHILNGDSLEDPMALGFNSGSKNYEFLTWINWFRKLYLLIDNEIIAYEQNQYDAGAGLYTLRYLNRGLFGTAVQEHVAGTEIKAIAAFGVDGGLQPHGSGYFVSSSIADRTRGLYIDELFMLIACGIGRMPPEDIASYPIYNSALAQNYQTPVGWSTSSASIDLTSQNALAYADFPAQGFVKIDSEILFFRRYNQSLVDTPNVLNFWDGIGGTIQFSRGLFNTSLSSGSGIDIELLGPSVTAMLWRPNLEYSRFFDKPEELKKMLNTLFDSTGTFQFVNADGKMDLGAYVPPLIGSELPVVTDQSSILNERIKVIPTDKKERITKAKVFYKPARFQSGTKPDNYSGRLVVWDILSESPNSYGYSKTREFFLSWIFRDVEAWFVGGLYARAYNKAPRRLELSLDSQFVLLSLNDRLIIETAEIVNADGSVVEGNSFSIISINQVNDEIVEIVGDSLHWEDFIFRQVAPTGTGSFAGGDGVNFWICGSNGLFAFDGSQGYSFL